MMISLMSQLRFLDFVWRGLYVVTIVATFFLVFVVIATYFVDKRITDSNTKKWFLNWQFLILPCVIGLTFTEVSILDQDLANRCFDQFARAGANLSVTRILALSYLVIVMSSVLFHGLKILVSLRIPNALQDLKDPVTEGLFAELCLRMRIRTQPRAFLSHQNSIPHAFGLLHHRVVLPETVVRTDDRSTLKAVLAHELHHVVERDSIWMLTALACRILLFYHPLVYLLSKKHALIAEKAADEAAIRITGLSVATFLQAMLKVVSICRPTPGAILQLDAGQNFRQLKARMENLALCETRREKPMEDPRSRRRFVSWMSFAAVLSIGFSFTEARIAISGFRPADDEAVLVCRQVIDEKWIDSWLHVEEERNKCESFGR